MTMPHLMNCGHIPDGWCLDCVGEIWNKRAPEPAAPLAAMSARELAKKDALNASSIAMAFMMAHFGSVEDFTTYQRWQWERLKDIRDRCEPATPAVAPPVGVEWACSECGSMEGFVTVTDYEGDKDVCCNNCGSVRTGEAPTVMRELALKVDELQAALETNLRGGE